MSNIPLQSAKRPLFESGGRSGSCLGDPQINLLECLSSGNLTAFSDSLVDSISSKEEFPLPTKHWINSPIESEDGKSILILALEKRAPKFVELLLKFGAGANHFNESYGVYPIHIPSRNGDLESLKLLFRYSTNSADPNATMRINGRTPLHIMAENNFVEGVEYLLRQNPKADIKDKKGAQTPLFLAVFKRADPSIVRSLLKYGADPDIKCLGSKTARDLIEKHYDIALEDYSSSKSDANPEKTVSIQRLGEIVETLGIGQGNYFQLLNEFQFGLIQYKEEDITDYRFPGNMTLVQKICDQGIEDCLKYFFNTFPNVNPDSIFEGLPPVLISAQRKSRPLLQILADKKANFTATYNRSNESILHILLKDGNKKSQDALKFVLNDPDLDQQIRSIINKKNLLGDTALHLAAQKHDQEIVKRLLQLGANIGIKNMDGEVPVTNILPSTMEDFLNQDCLSSKGDVNHDDFELEFDYSFLAPPYEDVPFEMGGLQGDDESMIHIKSGNLKLPYKSALPEMNSLWIMAQSKEHRHLLKHPVITSFLWCKWGRIRPFFNRNMRFFMTFVFLTTWFIFENYGGNKIKNEKNYITFFYFLYIVFTLFITGFICRDLNNDISDMMAHMKNGSTGRTCISVLLSSWFEICLVILLFTLLLIGAPFLTKALFILLLCLLCREILNLAVSVKRYVLSLEKLVQVALILFMSILIFDSRRTESYVSLHRHIAGTTIVLSWASLVTLIGRHPKLMRYNIYVTMFYKVMQTFFYFLVWYALFIIAFGLGFYIILHKEDREEDGYVFFDTPVLSMIKTSTMFVGELEFSDIPIDISGPYSFFSYGFFLSFVFLIVVVLMNLLNGLAVSDTGMIQEKAEIVGYVTRVETISYRESVLLGDPFDFLSNWPKIKWIRNIPSISFLRQVYRNKYLQKFFHKVTGATGILLFYSFLPDKKLKIRPNEKVEGCPCFKIHQMDRSIISSAKKIVLSQQFKEQNVDVSELAAKVDALTEFLIKSEERQKLMMDKLNNIENPLDTWNSKN